MQAAHSLYAEIHLLILTAPAAHFSQPPLSGILHKKVPCMCSGVQSFPAGGSSQEGHGQLCTACACTMQCKPCTLTSAHHPRAQGCISSGRSLPAAQSADRPRLLSSHVLAWTLGQTAPTSLRRTVLEQIEQLRCLDPEPLPGDLTSSGGGLDASSPAKAAARDSWAARACLRPACRDSACPASCWRCSAASSSCSCTDPAQPLKLEPPCQSSP